MISIIIIVKNDRRIDVLLKKLQSIHDSKTEVIIVDASNGVLNDIRNKYPFVNWIEFKNSESKKTTIPEQRNVGVKAAKGDTIVFIDSDCQPAPNWLSELVAPIKDGKEYITTGKVELSDEDSLHAIESEKHEEEEYVNEAPTMNIAIKKEVFDKIGYFDVKFQCGEDVDFVWRAAQKGYKVRFVKSAIIYHDLGNIRSELKRMFVYGKARVKLFRKHTYRYRNFIGSEVFKIFYPLFFIFLPITFAFPFYLMFGLLLVAINMSTNIPKTILLKTVYGAGMLKELIVPERL